ncbi:MAG: two-component system, NtrC family, sensor kinase [Solirubrobacteraceae bacterium]|nr:two-component system, NtrC family, sensor kinase [Solirubrobacteraceae bacterium]
MIQTLRQPWLLYAAAVGAVAVAYLAGPLNTGLVMNLIGASAIVATVVGARRNSPQHRLPWYLFALSQALFVSADVLSYNYTRFFGGELPFPSIADLCYLALYPPLIGGLLLLVRRRSPGRDVASLIDSLIVAVGVGTISWIYLIAPYAQDETLALSTKLISIAYPVMDIVVLAVAVRLAVGAARRETAFRLLIVGVVAELITDVIYGSQILHGTYEAGSLLDGGWIVFYVLFGAAALHPSVRGFSQRQPETSSRLTPPRLALLAGATLLVPAVQIVQAVVHQKLGLSAVTGAASIVVFTLVVLRMAGLVRIQEASTRRERTLREETERLMAEREQMELELRLAQKLEAVGQLAAGMAHEINTPIQFVGDTVRFLDDAFTDVQGLVDDYRSALAAAVDGRPPDELAQKIAQAEETADFEYLQERIPKALQRASDGLERVSTIVRAMREFAHPPTTEMAPADLNAAIKNTLIVTANEYRYLAELETDLAELPPVYCNIGDINQVILNLIVNASHAIEDATGAAGGPGLKGTIRVSSQLDGEDVLVTVADTGCGIPDDVRSRIFDPFFTTKGVGRGTGQGLAISRTIINDKHGGSLTFQTAPGEGTTFELRLPLLRMNDAVGMAA